MKFTKIPEKPRGEPFASRAMVPLNPCELEIELFCRGMRIAAGASTLGVRGVTPARAGLGSGLDVALPGGRLFKHELWVNVPVTEPFAKVSPFVLTGDLEHGFGIVDESTGDRYRVRLPERPEWYDRQTANDTMMSRVGVLQGTYLGIYVNPVCAFWTGESSSRCRFCTTGRNVGVRESATKSIADVVETCHAAKQESGVTFVHLNGGYQGERGLEFVKPYVAAIKEKVGLLVGVQLAPERDFTRYDELVALGVDHFSFCVELIDPEWFARICPGKARVHGQQLYFSAMQYCAELLPAGAVSGEIIAGLEPIERTLEGIERIADLGAFPTVCIFRPTEGSDLADLASPSPPDMKRVMRHVYDACRRHWLPIGAAPNIEVSLVVNADDAAMLAERTMGFYAYEAYRRFLRMAAAPMFARRMRATA